MSKQSKEFNYAYNSGFYAGQADAARQLASETDDIEQYALAELALVLSRKEGYVRLGCDATGIFWARFKWTAGPLAGHYTFGSGTSPGLAFAQVCEHVHEVDAGKRKPSKDTGYKRR